MNRTPLKRGTKPLKRRSPRKAKEADCDRLFSKFIRLRDGECQECGSTVNLQCAHLVPRGYRSVRFDPQNAVALCASDHKRYTHRPLEWDDWCSDYLGAGPWRALKRRARVFSHRRDFTALVAELEQMVAEVS